MSKIAKEIVRFSKEYFQENYIPLHRPVFNGNEKKYLSECIDSNFVSSVGSYVNTFEQQFSEFTNSSYAISTISGTAALHLSLLGINLKKNDIVIMPVINFIAAANMANNLGAKIFFADVDPFTAQMTPDNLEECIKKNKLKKIKAVVTMYNGGKPNNALEFYKLKKKI